MNWPIVLADVILVVHFLYATTVVLLIPLIFVGWWRKWAWVRKPWLRILHLLMIGVVVAEVGLGWDCPLTLWERDLRIQGGEWEVRELPPWEQDEQRTKKMVETHFYQRNFLARLVRSILFVDLSKTPAWLLHGIYIACGIVIIGLWIVVPPRWSQRPSSSRSTSA
jgi:hypothetical protein